MGTLAIIPDTKMSNQASGGGKTEQFRTLMATYGLSVDDVATLTSRNVKTVYAWRQGEPNAIPNTILELLELKLASQSKAASQ